MTDDSYHMPICIGIDIRISIGKIFSSVLGIESIEKSGMVHLYLIDCLAKRISMTLNPTKE